MINIEVTQPLSCLTVSRRVFSQDFQNQVIPGLETKTKRSCSPVDSDENL